MKNKLGFTLIELMVSMALFSMMMLLVGMVMQRAEAQTNLNENRMIIQENLREGLYKMGQEIRESSPTQLSITNGGTQLSFRIPANVSNSGVIAWSSPILYQVGGNGTQLIRTDTGTGVSTVLANHVQTVTFTSAGAAATITYDLTLRRTLTNGRIISIVSRGQARLRNT